MVGLVWLFSYDCSLRHLKQIHLLPQLQSLLRTFDGCTEAKTISKNGNVSHNDHLSFYTVWSFRMSTNSVLSLLCHKTMRAILLIHFFFPFFLIVSNTCRTSSIFSHVPVVIIFPDLNLFVVSFILFSFAIFHSF